MRRAAKGLGQFLWETVGEAVAEVILTALARAWPPWPRPASSRRR
ncbi:hypothetical protein ACFWUZ_18435 [Streptomyces sp. NPDC058646]